ncbi:MAG: Undecaprenyl-phosphate mannosyltransferase [Candidatus Dichloromethanomonas elyunquensis]|nr:MAG: Undecaprenyl-phosphate mannosyltransferase [Candidatus Dichloromethanomonas elyunquensis]
MLKNRFLIIIPAYNEEKNITKVLHGIFQHCPSCDVLVVNDGSKDSTSQTAKKEGVFVIDHLYNIGYGGALQTGFKYAVTCGYEFVIQFDADGQHDPKDILKIIEYLETKDYDIVIGSRFLNDSAKVGLLKEIAIKYFSLLIKVFAGKKITDPTSGLQGLNNHVFSYYAIMGNFPEDFPDADTLIHMLKRNCRVIEIPANIRERMSGESMHIGMKTIYYFFKMLVSIAVVVLKDKALSNKQRGNVDA